MKISNQLFELRMPFKTPNRFMAGLITVTILALYGFVLTAPVWAKVSFDESLKQTLLSVLMICVGFYLGSSKESGDKNDTIANLATATPNAVQSDPAK